MPRRREFGRDALGRRRAAVPRRRRGRACATAILRSVARRTPGDRPQADDLTSCRRTSARATVNQ